jgi:hypothetical protein
MNGMCVNSIPEHTYLAILCAIVLSNFPQSYGAQPF